MTDRPKIPWLAMLPPALFTVLAGVFFVGLYRENPNDLPSEFAGKPAPEFEAQKIPGLVPFGPDALSQPGVKLVNFWASWCGPCRSEHKHLMTLAAKNVPIYGINHKDRPAAALAFLGELGDPYVAVGGDPNGRVGFEWGVYGIPETFVLDGQGQVIFRHPGPITPQVLNDRLLPAIEAANRVSGAGS